MKASGGLNVNRGHVRHVVTCRHSAVGSGSRVSSELIHSTQEKAPSTGQGLRGLSTGVTRSGEPLYQRKEVA